MTLSNVEFINWENSKKVKNSEFIDGIGLAKNNPEIYFKEWNPSSKFNPINNEITDNKETNAIEDLDTIEVFGDDESIPDNENENENEDVQEKNEVFEAPVPSTFDVEDDEKIAKEFIYTKEDFDAFGDEKYLEGYNACKKNEELEFNERVSALENLLENIKEENCDASEFFQPINGIIIKIIESVLQVELKESKKSVEKIISLALKEIEAPYNDEINVFLNPEEYLIISKANNEKNINYFADERIKKGDIKLKMDDKIIQSVKKDKIEEIVNKVFRIK
jgi:hypothetical protein